MKELLLCALHRLGRPSTAAAILDKAQVVATIDEHWPNRHVPTSVHKVSRELRHMESTGELVKGPEVKEDGNLRPTYVPRDGTFYADYDVPAPPLDESKQHPVTTLSQHQQIVLFDSFQAMLETYARQAKERQALDCRHADEMNGVWERWRGRLQAAGLGE